MKNILFILSCLFLSISFFGCASFSETYKPLYQVKPEVKSLKEK